MYVGTRTCVVGDVGWVVLLQVLDEEKGPAPWDRTDARVLKGKYGEGEDEKSGSCLRSTSSSIICRFLVESGKDWNWMSRGIVRWSSRCRVREKDQINETNEWMERRNAGAYGKGGKRKRGGYKNGIWQILLLGWP